MTIQDLARICHEANRAYCRAIGDYSQLDWFEAPLWQRQSAINGVQFHLDNPDASPAHSHENWLCEKEKDGWKYGPVKSPAAKEHPCFVPYRELPIAQQKKDALFIAIVNTFRDSVDG